jgi:hypothetical protein
MDESTLNPASISIPRWTIRRDSRSPVHVLSLDRRLRNNRNPPDGLLWLSPRGISIAA